MNRRGVVAGLVGAPLFATLPASAQSGAFDQEAELDIAASLQEELSALGGTKVGGLAERRAATRGAGILSTAETRALISRGRDYQVPQLNESVRALLQVKYWRLAEIGRPAPEWTDKASHPDYAHLSSFSAPAAPFLLNENVLKFLAARNRFVFREQRPVRLFGLRGCAIAAGTSETDWATEHRLDLATPNHVEMKCTLGVWRVADGQIKLFRASTVPQVANMYAAVQSDGWGASLLPTGLYRYRAGTHNKATRPQPGALKNDDFYVVLRTARDMKYDPAKQENVWTIGGAHNIHAAGLGAVHPKFDSAGCQVIQGRYDQTRQYAEGDWSSFRQAAGLVGADGLGIAEETPGAGTFDYMLLTGLEAALAKQESADFMQRYWFLRHGSRGEAVRAAQTQLYTKFPTILGRNAPAATGAFGPETAFAALLESKERSGEYLSTVLQTAEAGKTSP